MNIIKNRDTEEDRFRKQITGMTPTAGVILLEAFISWRSGCSPVSLPNLSLMG